MCDAVFETQRRRRENSLETELRRKGVTEVKKQREREARRRKASQTKWPDLKTERGEYHEFLTRVFSTSFYDNFD